MYNIGRKCAEEKVMKKLIEFKNVSFRYDDDGPNVLKDISFTIAENESVAIIGHNGSGKSTVAKLMNGLLAPRDGEIWINGRLLTEEAVWDIRKDVGMVFQNPDNQFVGATVQDDVAFGLENRGIERSVMVERIENALQTVRMEKYMDTEPYRLSGGQKQRVAIAGVLAILPKVLILDEATVMLDPQGRQEMMDTITQLQETRDMSLITITHDLHEILRMDRVIVLNEGEKWADTTPRELMKKGELLKEIGLALPFTTALSHVLRAEGIRFQTEPLTIDEMVEELWILHSKT